MTQINILFCIFNIFQSFFVYYNVVPMQAIEALETIPKISFGNCRDIPSIELLNNANIDVTSNIIVILI